LERKKKEIVFKQEGIMTTMTKAGLSTTIERDCFRYETARMFDIIRTQWDYRDAAGKLHSGIAKDLGAAIEQAKKHGYNG
jgi:hypothetical protein